MFQRIISSRYGNGFGETTSTALASKALPTRLSSPSGSDGSAFGLELVFGATRSKTAEFSLKGCDGATSVKAEIIGQMPIIKDASGFREVRRLLLEELGGVAHLLQELVFAGFVDPSTQLLTTDEKPFNVFARIVARKLVQHKMEEEQQALGMYASRFVICRNKPDNDLHWDSSDPKWIEKASMARRHRFLTTRNLHWQWFNLLICGLLGAQDGGAEISAARDEVRDMEAAAMHYAKNMGWSSNVGLFVNIFGHNSVNSLFVHILDLSQTGPAFESLEYKNLPLSEVIRVLDEEASVDTSRRTLMRQPTAISLVDLSKRRFFFAGTDGATSLKAEIVGRIPVLRDAACFREARRLLREELGGMLSLREELVRAHLINADTELLTTGEAPFNIFARIAAGVMKPPGFEEEQKFLGDYQERYCICKNRPENDERWDSDDPEWVGKASMARRHRFLTTKDLHWRWFNALIFGMVGPRLEDEQNFNDLSFMTYVIGEVETMKVAALTYAAKAGWSKDIGLYFHVFGHNTVNSLHLHILDREDLGPTYLKYEYKNLPIDVVLKVLGEEFNNMLPPDLDLLKAAEDAVHAAKRQRSLSMQPYFEDGGNDIIDLNVGGVMITVSKRTLAMAPQESLLRRMFSGSWDSALLQRDSSGKIYLDLPGKSFGRLVDHMRLINFLPPGKLIMPPIFPQDEEQEMLTLAGQLGIVNLLMGPQRGWSVDPVPPSQERMRTADGDSVSAVAELSLDAGAGSRCSTRCTGCFK